MIKKIGLYITTFVFLCACSSTKKNVHNIGVWVNQENFNKPYKKIYIASFIQNTILNSALESAFGNEFDKRSMDYVKHSDLFTTSFIKLEKGEEMMYTKIYELKCDAIITISLLNVKSDTRYVPGDTTYNPMKHSFYDSFYGYYHSYYDKVVTPGYYEDDKTYYLECNMFDVKTNKLIFSIQSKAYNPTDIDAICKSYSTEVVKNLEKKQVLTKEPKTKG